MGVCHQVPPTSIRIAELGLPNSLLFRGDAISIDVIAPKRVLEFHSSQDSGYELVAWKCVMIRREMFKTEGS